VLIARCFPGLEAGLGDNSELGRPPDKLAAILHQMIPKVLVSHLQAAAVGYLSVKGALMVFQRGSLRRCQRACHPEQGKDAFRLLKASCR
jgi:hypothetical protein